MGEYGLLLFGNLFTNTRKKENWCRLFSWQLVNGKTLKSGISRKEVLRTKYIGLGIVLTRFISLTFGGVWTLGGLKYFRCQEFQKAISPQFNLN